MTKLSPQSAGLTLFEVLIVISIASAAIVTGAFGWTKVDALFKVRSAVEETKSLLQQARELAIANKNSTGYQIELSQGLVKLEKSDNTEVTRYQLPTQLSTLPSSITISFAPVTADITGCTLPCQFTFSLRNESQTLIIYQNGIID